MTEAPPFDPATVADTISETDPIIPDPNEFLNDPEAQEAARRFTLNFGGDRPKREKKAKAPKVVPPKPRPGVLKKPLMEMYGGVGMMVSLFDPQCGTVVMQNAERCAETMETLARENPAVRRVVLQMVATSVWGQVMAAHLPIIYGIALHHVPALRDSPMGQFTQAQFAANMDKAKKAKQADEAEMREGWETDSDAASRIYREAS